MAGDGRIKKYISLCLFTFLIGLAGGGIVWILLQIMQVGISLLWTALPKALGLSAGAAGLTACTPGTLLYIGPGCESVELRCTSATRLLLLGGEPWAEPPLLWWNFVGREPAEMHTWAADWTRADGGRFGEVTGYVGQRLTVPPVPALRKP